MKKLIVLMLILALCTACFAGCGGKNETTTTGGSESIGENSGTDAATNGTENDDILSTEDLETLPEEGDENGLFPEIDIDIDVDVDPTEDTTNPTTSDLTQPTQDNNTDETTEPETTDSTTAEPTQSTQDSNTEETTEPTKPPKDYTGDDEDDFVIDFGDLIGKG